MNGTIYPSLRHVSTDSLMIHPLFAPGRHMRTVWKRAYLKDLYHRRQLIGADPLISRSAYPNWLV